MVFFDWQVAQYIKLLYISVSIYICSKLHVHVLCDHMTGHVMSHPSEGTETQGAGEHRAERERADNGSLAYLHPHGGAAACRGMSQSHTLHTHTRTHTHTHAHTHTHKHTCS